MNGSTPKDYSPVLIFLATLGLVWGRAALVAGQESSTPPAPTFEARLEALDCRSSATRDLSSDFIQEKFTSLLKKPLRSHGTVRVVEGLTRWDTESPHPVRMLLTEHELRLYFPDRKTMEVYRLDDKLAQIVLSPKPSLSVLRALFDLAEVVASSFDIPDQPKRSLGLLLTPKADGLRRHVRTVRVLIDEAEGVARQVEMTDADGDRTILRFQSVRLNTGLTRKDLEFNPPSGTHVTRPLADLENLHSTPRESRTP